MIGDQLIHDQLDLTVNRGEILGLVGGSGSGKSVLLKSIIGLLRPAAGTIHVFGTDIYSDDETAVANVKRRWGVLFQANALFSTLTVCENVQVPLRENARLPQELLDQIAALKVRQAGLPDDALFKYPSELSGGMQKRAGVARAIAIDPELLLLDEPTSGLDPIMAGQIDRLIHDLAHGLGLTVVLVTHDIDTLYAICDRVAALADKHIVAVAPVRELEHCQHPWVQEYLLGKRSRTGAMSILEAEQRS
ncbi:ATP-binding cassette domain-containing protein [Sphingomonas sp. H39-1-10]|uniref:ABC transporter ATP-binding protein n=1 Tax=Sphingomonas pollutisoli TaxID=3030829 RepID=UPI0023B9837C|nr:ATP-binding cassette domain-containing protein [Sphingomonas pollutisoli]MDF0490519.1 ATP-binding cassette domain-containing protein [Sphingomonas pollutisoli]